jgi:UDPglucose--hexose-1-phosphate uridylyltransferase
MSASPRPPEYRRDPVTGRWVLIAPERAARPLALSHVKPHDRRDAERDRCPFCEGREENTPLERFAIRAPGSAANGPGWQLRVVPNKFPAVRPLAATDPLGLGLLESVPGHGEHELVIPCARHESNPVRLTDDEFADLLRAYRERLLTLADDPRLAYATVFQNVGAEAGASLAHLHSQILATPFVPDGVQQELDGSRRHFERTGSCVFCDILRHEVAAGERVVVATARFVVLLPFAGRFAYETWVLPRTHESRYEALADDAAGELAGVMRDVLGRLDAVLDEPAYNYYLHTAPLRSGELPHYHWHLEVIPRTARAAGFEWGSGCFINTVAPERAAAELRAAN